MTSLLDSLKRKLHPARFTAMSARMAACVAAVLGEYWAKPRLFALVITSDGWLLGRDETLHQHFIGGATEWRRNLDELLAAADLTTMERQEFEMLYRRTVTDWEQKR